METFSVPPVLLAGSWPPIAAPAPKPKAKANPTPRAAPTQFQPQTSLSTLSRTRPNLTQLFQTDGFLNTMTMDGMNVLLQKLTGNFDEDFMRNRCKGTMIAKVMEVNQINVLDQLVPLIDSLALLSTIQNAGLDLILRCLGLSNAGDKDAKIRTILRFLPLNIYVQDVHGSHGMIVQRNHTGTQFAAEVLMSSSTLKVGDDVMQLMHSLGMYNIQSGTVITNENLPLLMPQAAASSTDAQGSAEEIALTAAEEIALTAALLDKAGFQDYDAAMLLVVKDTDLGIHVIEVVADDTMADVKAKVQAEGVGIEGTSIIFAGKPVNDDRKIRDYKLRTGSVLHLVSELDG